MRGANEREWGELQEGGAVDRELLEGSPKLVSYWHMDSCSGLLVIHKHIKD